MVTSVLWLRWRRWLAICGLVLVCVGGGSAAWYLRANLTVRITPQGDIAVSRRQPADEPRPSAAAVQTYHVAPERPRYLTIDRIGVAARVLPVGLDNAERIAAPKGIWDVGWYSGSVRPGETGVSFIDGHITGPSLPAVFRDLGSLRAGDEVTVERGDGQRYTYHVNEVRQQPYSEINMSQLLAGDPRARMLVLMTCAGNFDAATYHYDQRIVVIATMS